MPRFLNTSTGLFVWISDPLTTTYAILSHTWRPEAEGGEQSYEDVRKLQTTVMDQALRLLKLAVIDELRTLSPPIDSATARVPKGKRFKMPQANKMLGEILSHPDLDEKIKGACIAARDAGFQLLWIDSCCIDKSSSAELSEAINSMYEWYRLSDTCFVYLADVSSRCPATELDQAFARSRWHRRGWTLQELIAPSCVLFLTAEWVLMGTKMSRAAQLSKITRVDLSVLIGQRSLQSVSVARRMSWAVGRETTRVEDRAYSLMGIFGVHLSPIYGEGTKAFLRLQEEVIKLIPDQSIFAWGRSCVLRSEGWEGAPIVPQVMEGFGRALLAHSPDNFRDAAGISPLSRSSFASSIGWTTPASTARLPSLHSVFTPEGVQIPAVCVDFARTHPFDTVIATEDDKRKFMLCKQCLALGRAHQLALLRCRDEEGFLIALPLCRRQDSEEGQSLAVGLVGLCERCTVDSVGRRSIYRTVRITPEAMCTMREHIFPKPINISLVQYLQTAPMRKSARPGLAMPDYIKLWSRWMWSQDLAGSVVEFHVSPWCVAVNEATSGARIYPPECQRFESEEESRILLTTFVAFPPRPSVDTPPRLLLQSLSIELSFRLVHPYALAGIEKDTELVFAVTNTFAKHRDSPAVPGAPLDSSTLVSVREAPWSDLSDGVHITYFHSVPTTQRVLAEAVFVLHAAEDDWAKDVFLARTLHLRLERSIKSSVVPDPSNLFLSIDMSDEHPFSIKHFIDRYQDAAVDRPIFKTSTSRENPRGTDIPPSKDTRPRKQDLGDGVRAHEEGTQPHPPVQPEVAPVTEASDGEVGGTTSRRPSGLGEVPPVALSDPRATRLAGDAPVMSRDWSPGPPSPHTTDVSPETVNTVHVAATGHPNAATAPARASTSRPHSVVPPSRRNTAPTDSSRSVEPGETAQAATILQRFDALQREMDSLREEMASLSTRSPR